MKITLMLLSLCTAFVASNGLILPPPPNPDEAPMPPPQEYERYGEYGWGICRDEKSKRTCNWVKKKDKCHLDHFSRWCKKTCGLCPTTTTTATTTTTTEATTTLEPTTPEPTTTTEEEPPTTTTTTEIFTETTTTTTTEKSPKITTSTMECRDNWDSCNESSIYWCTFDVFKNNCKKFCNKCDGTTAGPTPEPQPCVDSHELCVMWKQFGFCQFENLSFTLVSICPKTCGFCDKVVGDYSDSEFDLY